MTRTKITNHWLAIFTECAKKARQPKPEIVAELILKKCSTMMGNLRQRSKDAGATFAISLEAIREAVALAYGDPCPYCEDTLKVTKSRGLSADHINPLTRGGMTTPENIEIICQRCNRRKDVIGKENFLWLMRGVNQWPEDERSSVLTRLSTGGNHYGRGKR